MKRLPLRHAFLAVILTTFLSSPAASQGIGGLTPLHRDSGARYREANLGSRDANTYHNYETLICSDCHVMHASMQHNYDGTTDGVGNISGFPWATTPSQKLLKAADPLDLCLSCHDGMAGIPDVLEADVNGLTERGGGFFNQPEVLNPRGHNLGRDLAQGFVREMCARCHWEGDMATASVTCIDCHSPHGNGNSRNLQWAQSPGSEGPMGLFLSPGATGMARYERENIRYGTANDATLREPSNICIDCHHSIMGASDIDGDGDGIHELHPVYESETGSLNNINQGLVRGTTNPDHWVEGSGVGFDGTQRVPFVVSGALDFASADVIDPETNGVLCLSCHKAHGSANPFGLVWEINGQIDRTGCDQCHLFQGH
jgi:hypothetical protein